MVDPIRRLQLKIRLARMAEKKTQQEVAKDLGVSLRTYQRLEAGKAPLDMETLYKISKSFQVDFLALTSPEFLQEDCKSFQFYSSDQEMLSIPEVDDESIIKIRKKIYSPDEEIIKVQPETLVKEEIFQKNSTPLFVSDIKNTVANKSLLSQVEDNPSSPWDLTKEVVTLSSYIKAWEVTLREDLAGFLLTKEKATGDFIKQLHMLFNPDQQNVLVIGQILN